MIYFLFQKIKRSNKRYYNRQTHIFPIPHIKILSIPKTQNFQNSNFPRNGKSLDLQRVDIISVSHTRREREPAIDKFEHWIERIKTLHFTSLVIEHEKIVVLLFRMNSNVWFWTVTLLSLTKFCHWQLLAEMVTQLEILDPVSRRDIFWISNRYHLFSLFIRTAFFKKSEKRTGF